MKPGLPEVSKQNISKKPKLSLAELDKFVALAKVDKAESMMDSRVLLGCLRTAVRLERVEAIKH